MRQLVAPRRCTLPPPPPPPPPPLIARAAFPAPRRRPKELRQLKAELGVLSSADGSALFEMGNTKVQAEAAACCCHCCGRRSCSLPACAACPTTCMRARVCAAAGAGGGVWAQARGAAQPGGRAAVHHQVRVRDGGVQHGCVCKLVCMPMW